MVKSSKIKRIQKLDFLKKPDVRPFLRAGPVRAFQKKPGPTVCQHFKKVNTKNFVLTNFDLNANNNLII